jgi:AcrR family transcriptional regulator
MKQGSKPAVQRRSRQTRDRIVDAMDRLLLDHDFRDINVTELAAEAQVSPGAIYRRFEGGLLPVLFELYRVTLQRRAEAPEADLDLAAAGGLRPALRQFARTVWAEFDTIRSSGQPPSGVLSNRFGGMNSSRNQGLRLRSKTSRMKSTTERIRGTRLAFSW